MAKKGSNPTRAAAAARREAAAAQTPAPAPTARELVAARREAGIRADQARVTAAEERAAAEREAEVVGQYARNKKLLGATRKKMAQQQSRPRADTAAVRPDLLEPLTARASAGQDTPAFVAPAAAASREGTVQAMQIVASPAAPAVTAPAVAAPAVAAPAVADMPKRGFMDKVRRNLYKTRMKMTFSTATRAQLTEKLATLDAKFLSAGEQALIAVQGQAAKDAIARRNTVESKFTLSKELYKKAKPDMDKLDALTLKEKTSSDKIKNLSQKLTDLNQKVVTLDVAIEAKEETIRQQEKLAKDQLKNRLASATSPGDASLRDLAEQAKEAGEQLKTEAGFAYTAAQQIVKLQNELDQLKTQKETLREDKAKAIGELAVEQDTLPKVQREREELQEKVDAHAADLRNLLSASEQQYSSGFARGYSANEADRAMLKKLVAAGGDVEKASKAKGPIIALKRLFGKAKGPIIAPDPIIAPNRLFGELVAARTAAHGEVTAAYDTQRAETKAVVKTREAILAEDKARKGLYNVQLGLNAGYIAAKESHSVALADHQQRQGETTAAQNSLTQAEKHLTKLKAKTFDTKGLTELATIARKYSEDLINKELIRKYADEVVSIAVKLEEQTNGSTHAQASRSGGEGIDMASNITSEADVDALEVRKYELEAFIAASKDPNALEAARQDHQYAVALLKQEEAKVIANEAEIAAATREVKDAKSALTTAKAAEKNAKAGLSIAEKTLESARSKLAPIAKAQEARAQKEELEAKLTGLKANPIFAAAETAVRELPATIKSAQEELKLATSQALRAEKAMNSAASSAVKASKYVTTARDAFDSQSEKVAELKKSFNFLNTELENITDEVLRNKDKLSLTPAEHKEFGTKETQRQKVLALHDKALEKYSIAGLEADNMNGRLTKLIDVETTARTVSSQASQANAGAQASLASKKASLTSLTGDLQKAQETLDSAKAMQEEIASLTPLAVSAPQRKAEAALVKAKEDRYALSAGSSAQRASFRAGVPTAEARRYQEVKGLLKGQIADSSADDVARKDGAGSLKGGTSVSTPAVASALIADPAPAKPGLFSRIFTRVANFLTKKPEAPATTTPTPPNKPTSPARSTSAASNTSDAIKEGADAARAQHKKRSRTTDNLVSRFPPGDAAKVAAIMDASRAAGATPPNPSGTTQPPRGRSKSIGIL